MRGGGCEGERGVRGGCEKGGVRRGGVRGV